MLRTLLKLAVILVVGILAYNYFLGTPKEKASSERIFNEVKDLGAATWDLLKSEKEKFDDGKYDEAIEKARNLFEQIRSTAGNLTQEASEKLQELEDQRQEISLKLQEAETRGEDLTREQRQQLEKDWDQLMKETEQLMKEIEKE